MQSVKLSKERLGIYCGHKREKFDYVVILMTVTWLAGLLMVWIVIC